MITKAPYTDVEFSKNYIFTKSARDAWKLVLNSIKKEKGYLNILLPSYIGITDREGSGIFDPVEITNANYSFYKVKENLSIDIESLEALIKADKFNVLLLVHYFGFCRNNLQTIRQICDENNIILVEDCAHAFHFGINNESLGIIGDFSFYSVHKYLAVQSGGILKNISGRIELLPLPEEDKMSYEVLLKLLNSENIAIAEKRIENFNIYKSELSDTEGIKVVYDLEENEIPQTFPLRIKNNKREPLYFHLMDMDLPTIALYYRLISQITKTDFPLSYEISHEILNLPLHQNTTKEDIIRLTKEIKKYLEN